VDGTVIPLSQIVQGSDKPANLSDSATSAATYGSASAVGSASTSEVSVLVDPSNSDPHANAYKLVRGLGLKGTPEDLSKDPIAKKAAQIYSGGDTNQFINSMASNCVTTVTPAGGGYTTRVPDYRVCERSPGPSSCSVTRPFESHIFSKMHLHYDGVVKHQLDFKVPARSPTAVTVSATGLNPEMQAAFAAVGLYYDVVLETNGADQPGNITLTTFSLDEWPDYPPGTLYNVTYDAQWSGTVLSVTVTPPGPANNYATEVYFYGPQGGDQWVSLDLSLTIGVAVPQPVVDSPPGCSTSATSCAAQPVAWTSSGSVADRASTDTWRCVDAMDTRTVGIVPITSAALSLLGALYPGEPLTSTSSVCYAAEARSFQCTY
jgi:hypothetical protein